MNPHRLGSVALPLALVASSACGEPTRSTLSVDEGRVTAVLVNPPGAWYPGEVRISGGQLGEFRAYVFTDSRVTIRTSKGSVAAKFDSFVAGDSVRVWYDPKDPVLTSLPPVIGIRQFEIQR